MFIMKGQYNIAKIFLPSEEHLENKTKNQIQFFLNHPALKGEPICIMPDCHFGKGAVIGFTMPLNEYVISNIVGVDIGCGMLSYNLGRMVVPLKELDNWVKENIPVGRNVYNHQDPLEWINLYIDKIYNQQNQNIINLPNKILDTSLKINPKKEQYFLNSLGSLGGGNHFLELGYDEEGNYWLTIHSGSRNFGLQIANYYRNKAIELCNKFFREEKDLAFLPLEYGGNEYLEDMEIAQQYASLNRMIMLNRIIEGFFKKQFSILNSCESIHNYIDFKDKIIRKGAISARDGKLVIIPFNMEDGLIIGEGKGNKEWNYSAPHGAGRIMSRKKAKETLDLNKAKDSMEKAGIYTTSLNNDTLDEVKEAYKDKDMILEMIKDTVEVLHFVKPVWNLKAGE